MHHTNIKQTSIENNLLKSFKKTIKAKTSQNNTHSHIANNQEKSKMNKTFKEIKRVVIGKSLNKTHDNCRKSLENHNLNNDSFISKKDITVSCIDDFLHFPIYDFL